MGNSTTYEVKLRYLVDSQGAAQAVPALTRETQRLGREASATRDRFRELAGAVIGAFGIQEAKKALIGFNADMEATKIGLSAMIQGNRGGDWDKATEQAAGLFQEFQRFSQLTPVTTKEMTEFGRGVAVATFQAGGGIANLTRITEQGVVAAKAFGYGSAYASLELTEMLMGNVNKRMMFARQLLGIAKMTEEEFKALNSEKRMAVVERVLGSDAMRNAAKAFGDSFAGVTSTFEDKLQITIGKVGLPLFKAITAEVKRWNEWLDQNDDKIRKLSDSVAHGLVEGFRYVKEVLSFLIDHAGAIKAIGEIWLATRVGGMLTSGVTGGRGLLAGVGDLRAWLRPESFRLTDGGKNYEHIAAGAGRTNVTMGNLGGSLPLLGQSAALGFAFGTIASEATGLKQALHDLAIGETGREFERVRKESDALAESLARAAAANPNQAAAVTNLQASAANYQAMANLAADAARASQNVTYNEGVAFTDPTFDRKMKALEEMGIGSDQIDKAGGIDAFARAMQAKADEIMSRTAAVTQTGQDAWELGLTALTDYQRQTLDVNKAQQDLLAYINRSMINGLKIEPKDIVELLRRDTDDPTGKHRPMSDKPNVTVHINRIEVQSDDPDRMAFGLIESFRDAAKNPSSAFAALREG